MAKNKFNFRKYTQTISLAIQGQCIKNRFPDFSYNITNGMLIAFGYLQPRITSPQYLLKMVYKLKDIPKIWVISPALHPNAVHLYADKHLCLYWPRQWSWRRDQIIANTIIPWAGSWLLFYELWLDTGKWLGPSSHNLHP